MEKNLYPLSKKKYIWVNTHRYKEVLITTLFISKVKLTKSLYSNNQKTEVLLYLLHARDANIFKPSR